MMLGHYIWPFYHRGYVGPKEELIELQVLAMESVYLDWKTETDCKRWHNQHLTWATELTSYKRNTKLKGCQVRSSTY